MRLLGAAHILVTFALIPLTTFFGLFSMLIIIPGLVWLMVLGFRLWRQDGSLRARLRVTHSVLAPFSILLVVYGLYCLRMARRSAEAGGGLLGAVGLAPIIMGALAGILALVSLHALQSGLFDSET
jgi:hypothetical protein